MVMRPIVDGLEDRYKDRITFVYLNAADNGEGEAVFEALALRGHPGFVIFDKDGKEVFRQLGQVDEAILVTGIKAVVNT
ncbi:MAG: hypothetical protein R3E39_22260 [Anaerolineae bacterium]